MKIKVRFFVLLFALLSVSMSGQEVKDRGLGTLWLCWENDTFLNTDRGFTNGLKLAWLSPSTKNPRKNSLFGWMPIVKKPGFLYVFSYSLRQDLFTPEDITRQDLIENDRPYAGYLHFEAGLSSLGKNRAASFSLSLGVIGPLSLGEDVQKFIHVRNAAPVPQGWSYQLGNELAVQIIYEDRIRWTLFGAKKGCGFDVIPHIAGGIGNVYTYASTGFQVRLGWNLPQDYGLPLLRPGGSSGVGHFEREPARSGTGFDGIYLFASVDGQVVLRNIFLDGNSFRESHSVEKEMLTGNIQIGLGIKVSYLNLTLAYVRWTNLFVLQNYIPTYLITNLSYSF